MKPRIMFFHGLESGPHGRKYHALSEHFDVESPDFQGMGIDERLAKATELTTGETDLIVVGSSFGGLLAALLYARHPERFFSYVLAAPALMLADEDEITAMPRDAVVVHGSRDDVVAIGPVRTLCRTFGIEVVEVDDDHRLAASIDVLIDATQRLVEARAAR